MQQEYICLLTKFYSKVLQGSRQSKLLSHSLERLMCYQVKQEQKNQRQTERDGSLRSGSSGTSLSGFEKVKRLFYSNHFETALLFYYCLNRIKQNQIVPLIQLMNQTNDRLKNVENGPGIDEKRKYGLSLAKFIDAIQFLEGRGGETREIDWLYFQAFKQFQPQALLAVQLIGSPADNLQSREALKTTNYVEVLKKMKSKCYLFDYSIREGKEFGQGHKLFIGRRSNTFFVLTQKQYQRANTTTATIGSSRKNIPLQEKSPPSSTASLPSNRFKEQFMAEILKLRQGYEANTATIASLFHFKDAEEGRVAEEMNQD